MTIRTRLLTLALLAIATCAFFPKAAFADGDGKDAIGTRSLEKELHRLEETMENLEEAIERAKEAGQRDTAKQLRATMDALRFVKKQIHARMEGQRAQAPKREKAERIKLDIEDLKRRREALRERQIDADHAKEAERLKREVEEFKHRRAELRERMQDTDRANKKGRDFIKRIRVLPDSVVAKDEHVIIVETDQDGRMTRRVIRSDGKPHGLLRLGDDIELDVEELVKRRRPDDREMRDKLREMAKRARDGRPGRSGKDGSRGRDGRDGGPQGDLVHRVEQLQHHVEELTQGLHHLRQQVEELRRANKKLHMHLRGEAEVHRVQVPKAPMPPKPITIRSGHLRGSGGGQGGMGGGQADDGRLARIEGLLKKLLELQIQQAKTR